VRQPLTPATIASMLPEAHTRPAAAEQNSSGTASPKRYIRALRKEERRSASRRKPASRRCAEKAERRGGSTGVWMRAAAPPRTPFALIPARRVPREKWRYPASFALRDAAVRLDAEGAAISFVGGIC